MLVYPKVKTRNNEIFQTKDFSRAGNNGLVSRGF